MREFEHKRGIRRFLLSPVVLISLGAVFIFLVRATWSIYEKNRDSRTELGLAEERLARLQERQETLTRSIEKLQTESGVEAEIRNRFQMAKEGETEVVIVEAPSAPTSPEPLKVGFFQKILNFFTR